MSFSNDQTTDFVCKFIEKHFQQQKWCWRKLLAKIYSDMNDFKPAWRAPGGIGFSDPDRDRFPGSDCDPDVPDQFLQCLKEICTTDPSTPSIAPLKHMKSTLKTLTKHRHRRNEALKTPNAQERYEAVSWLPMRKKNNMVSSPSKYVLEPVNITQKNKVDRKNINTT